MTLWLAERPLVLASRSAPRRALLEAAGIPIETHPADLDERSLEADVGTADPAAIATYLAHAKAIAVAQSLSGRLVLGADQTLALDGKRFAKPTDRKAARVQLGALSGRTHQLHTAIAFVRDSSMLFDYAGVAHLTMRRLSDNFVDLYLDAVGDAVMSSVGAYQLEGRGIQLFERVDGDYFTILGLPLMAALDFLRQNGCLAS